MNAFDYSRALMTFFDVRDTARLKKDEKIVIFEGMLQALPPEITVSPHSRATRNLLAEHINKAIEDGRTPPTATAPQTVHKKAVARG